MDDQPEFWASPGRISLAPELSRVDRMTWDAAAFAAVHPQIRPYPLWIKEVLIAMIAKQSPLFPLPDDPLDLTPRRPSPLDVGWYPVVDPAYARRPIVGGLP